MLVSVSQALAELVVAREPEGLAHGYLTLQSMEGTGLASGEFLATTRGDRVSLRLIFHFKDGSLDDETTVFTQRERFRLVSDRHVQRGPRFPHPYEMTIEAATGKVTVRTDAGGTEKDEVYHLDLPIDTANGMLLTLIKNFPKGATELKSSMVVLTPKPRVVTVTVAMDGKDAFRAGEAKYMAKRYTVRLELGGVMGLVAPVLGKQPRVDRVWVSTGVAPAILKIEAQTYIDGPMWRIELASPVWR